MTPKRILVVDDEVAFTNLVKLTLEKTGCYEVHVENNPTAVLATARQHRPDAILLDVIMPGKDGGQVLAELRTSGDMSGIPVMFLTATMSQHGLNQRDGTIMGMPFLAKPVDPKQLAKRLGELLD